MAEVRAEKDHPALAGRQAAEASTKHSRLLRRWAWPGSSCVLWAFKGGVQACTALFISLAGGGSIACCS